MQRTATTPHMCFRCASNKKAHPHPQVSLQQPVPAPHDAKTRGFDPAGPLQPSLFTSMNEMTSE